MQLNKALMAMAIAGLTLLTSTLALPKPAVAASCASNPSRTNCDGKDPSQQGCDRDAFTVATAYISQNGSRIGKVELRYSRKCKSNWARVISDKGQTLIKAKITRVDGKSYSYILNNTTSVFTDMVYAPNVGASAQGYIWYNSWQPYSARTPFI